MATSECSFGSGLRPWGLLSDPREERSRLGGSAETRREWGFGLEAQAKLSSIPGSCLGKREQACFVLAQI